MSQPSELRTRAISAVVLGAAALFITWWSWASFALMCALGGIVLLKEWRDLTRHRGWWWMVLGVMYIGAAAVSLIYLRLILDWFAIYSLFFMVWAGDTGAYLIGKKYGHHKIAPHISPGKSWEGLMGAITASFITACLLGRIRDTLIPLTPLVTSDVASDGVEAKISWIEIAGTNLTIAVAICVLGLLGDLFESSLKRKAGVKDSGTLIPGHGGLFDRLDSLIPCAIMALLIPLGYFIVGEYF